MIIKNEHVKFKTVKLKDVLTIKNGKSQKKIEDESGIYGIYGTGGLMGNTNSYIGEEKSIIIGRKGTIDSPLFMKEKYWVIDTAFYTDNFLYDSKYLYYIIKRINFHNYSKSAVIPSLTKNDLNEIDILVTEDFSYAKKISLYLDKEFSRLEKINILLKKIEIRNQYYADKLTSGQLKLNNAVSIINDKFENIVNEHKKSKVMAGDSLKEGLYPFFNCSKRQTLFSNDYLIDDGVLLLSTGGTAAVNYYNGKLSYSTDVWCITSKYTKYLYYFYNANIKKVEQCFQGGGLKHLSKKDFKNIEITMPNNEKDIQDIVDYLDNLNDEKEKIEKLLKLEEQRFEWLSDKLLSGEYIIED